MNLIAAFVLGANNGLKRLSISLSLSTNYSPHAQKAPDGARRAAMAQQQRGAQAIDKPAAPKSLHAADVVLA